MQCIFFFNDTATTEIYTLSLHDALPISVIVIGMADRRSDRQQGCGERTPDQSLCCGLDRKSTRLNSSHANISYAVFCLKKKKNITFLPMTSKWAYTIRLDFLSEGTTL